jgi:DHA2 family multidrug resistance protein
MIARGMSAHAAGQMALSVIDRGIGAQASVLAFSKIYLLSGLVLCCSLPLMLFWRHGRGRAAMQAH